MNKILKILLTGFFLSSTVSCFSAVSDTANHKSISVETFFWAGYTGFNQFLGVSGKWRNTDVYLGPVINLNYSNFRGHADTGVGAGLRQYYLSSASLASFVSLDYKLSFFRLYDPYNKFSTSTRNVIQELVLSLGAEYRFLSRMAVNLSFGYGIYRESYHTIRDPDDTSNFFGMMVAAKLGLKYQLIAL